MPGAAAAATAVVVVVVDTWRGGECLAVLPDLETVAAPGPEGKEGEGLEMAAGRSGTNHA